MPGICVFCGSGSGENPLYTEAAEELAELLSAGGHTIIYGGGSTGMMGHLANAALRDHGRIIGVIPTALATIELMHPEVQDMRVVPNMHARKALMHELADAYRALPGGFGTMEELFEALCWAQLDIHTAPVAVWNVDGYYDGLVRLLENMVAESFLSPSHHGILTELRDAADVSAWLAGIR